MKSWLERNALRNFFLIYLSTLSLCLPLDFHLIPDFGKELSQLLEPLLQYIGESLRLNQGPRGFAVYSDSLGMYMLFSLGIPFALLTQVVLNLVSSSVRLFLFQALKVFLIGFLALQLAQYGLQKLFMRQFFPLDGKLLLTPLGHLERDLLFWTTMGTSRLFNVITGGAELLVAVLILIPRLHPLGLILSTLILSHILLLNLSFNIDVKLLVILLLSTSSALVLPWCINLYFAMKTKEIRVPLALHHGRLKGFYWTVILVTVLEVGSGIHSAMTAQEKAPAGSLLTRSFSVIDPSLHNPERIHFHGSGYLIEEFENAEFKPIPMIEDRTVQVIQLTQNKEMLRYTVHGDTLFLSGTLDGDEVSWQLLELDLEQLPLKRDSFRWIAP